MRSMSSVTTTGERAFNQSAQLAVSLNFATNWKITLGWVYNWEVFFECPWHTDIWLLLEIMLDNKNLLRWFKNHFFSRTDSLLNNTQTYLVLQFSGTVMLYWYVPTHHCRVFIHSFTSSLHQPFLITGCIFMGHPVQMISVVYCETWWLYWFVKKSFLLKTIAYRKLLWKLSGQTVYYLSTWSSKSLHESQIWTSLWAIFPY